MNGRRICGRLSMSWSVRSRQMARQLRMISEFRISPAPD
jgi:hypothetical protein